MLLQIHWSTPNQLYCVQLHYNNNNDTLRTRVAVPSGRPFYPQQTNLSVHRSLSLSKSCPETPGKKKLTSFFFPLPIDSTRSIANNTHIATGIVTSAVIRISWPRDYHVTWLRDCHNIPPAAVWLICWTRNIIIVLPLSHSIINGFNYPAMCTFNYRATCHFINYTAPYFFFFFCFTVIL